MIEGGNAWGSHVPTKRGLWNPAPLLRTYGEHDDEGEERHDQSGDDAAVVHMYTEGRRGASRKEGEDVRRTFTSFLARKMGSGRTSVPRSWTRDSTGP